MKKVEIYTKNWCGYCRMAKRLLRGKGVQFDEINVSSSPEREQEMISRAQRNTVPQILIDGVAVGGYDDIAWLDREGRLDELLGLATESRIAPG